MGRNEEVSLVLGGRNEKPPSRYQRLDLFIKVLSLLCPNLTDASKEMRQVGDREAGKRLTGAASGVFHSSRRRVHLDHKVGRLL